MVIWQLDLHLPNQSVPITIKVCEFEFVEGVLVAI
jgi:hypothetical protein